MKEDTTIWLVIGLISMIDPHAAMGAAFGCAFHLTLPRSDNENRFLLAIFSYGLGYGAGYAVELPHTMWVSVVVAALASTLMSVMYTMLIDGKDAPDWVKYLVDSILRIRR